MRRTRTSVSRARAAVTAAVVSLAVVAGSYSGAGAVASYHGNDFSYDFDLYRGVRACDQESDSNKIKGGFATSVYGGETGSAADNDGANNLCGAGGPGSGGEYLAAKALERGKLTIRDVDLVNIGNPDIPAALASGSVDAAIAGAPYSDQAVEKGGAKVLATDLTPGLMTVAFVGSGKFIKERPEVAERFVLALTEAARMMQGADYLSKENIDAYMKYTATTEQALKKATPSVYDPNMEIPLKGLADVERVHRENGRTDYDTPIDLKKVVDTQFVDKAVADLGKAKN